MNDSIKFLIEQLTNELSNNSSIEEKFKALKPIDNVMDNKPLNKKDHSFFAILNSQIMGLYYMEKLEILI